MKWKPLRIAAVLFIITMLSSSMLSGTLAKYTVSDSSEEYAHVAKWGITVFSRGSLYGKMYSLAPTNTITENDDGSITVKSHNAATLGSNVVAPGTSNTAGLEFGLSGVAETALKVELTIRNQNIVLNPNDYYFLHKIPEAVTAENFATLKSYYGAIYTEEDGEYTELANYATATTYYTVTNATSLASAYYPVVYEIEPSDGSHGFKATHAGIKGYSDPAPAIGINNKSLDIISYFLLTLALDADVSWAEPDANNIYEYVVSLSFPAGTNLETINSLHNVTESMASERLKWSWNYQQSTQTALYNAADNILGRLSAEKIYGPLQDDIVVIRKDATTLARPIEYEDYCLDTSFDIQITITQIN